MESNNGKGETKERQGVTGKEGKKKDRKISKGRYGGEIKVTGGNLKVKAGNLRPRREPASSLLSYHSPSSFSLPSSLASFLYYLSHHHHHHSSSQVEGVFGATNECRAPETCSHTRFLTCTKSTQAKWSAGRGRGGVQRQEGKKMEESIMGRMEGSLRKRVWTGKGKDKKRNLEKVERRQRKRK